MWFAALAGDCRSQAWFLAFERRLLEGSPEVLGLLRENPFPQKPPRYVRARLFLYRFTGRRGGGAGGRGRTSGCSVRRRSCGRRLSGATAKTDSCPGED